MISYAQRSRIARAWFSGSNPYLNDATPLALLRDKPLDEIHLQDPVIAYYTFGNSGIETIPVQVIRNGVYIQLAGNH